jgi:pyrroloquinoline quinone biosynthesis protein B
MHVRVLGSAAGGGFPQWNCGCANCADLRAGAPNLHARTQDSLAVSADGEHWFLLNASPDVRSQIEGFAALHPRERRHSPIAAVALTNGDLDHCLGLLLLRESQPLVVYATERVIQGLLDRNAVMRTLDRFHGHVRWQQLHFGREQALVDASGRALGISLLAVAVPGNPPLHLRNQPASPEDNIALFARDERGFTLAYAPSVAALGDWTARLTESSCLFFDGTFWSDDEPVGLGRDGRRARDMSHLPIGGDEGSLRALDGRVPAQRFFTHINNTNPILRVGSPEHDAVVAAGWQVAMDGMEVRR